MLSEIKCVNPPIFSKYLLSAYCALGTLIGTRGQFIHSLLNIY
jgi:hypothetical protein